MTVQTHIHISFIVGNLLFCCTPVPHFIVNIHGIKDLGSMNEFFVSGLCINIMNDEMYIKPIQKLSIEQSFIQQSICTRELKCTVECEKRKKKLVTWE